jgi:hypothetical protein
MVDRSLVDAVEMLDPQSRQRRWKSLSYCVLDAIWSIGASYDTVVAPLVWRVAAARGDSAPLVSVIDDLPPDPLPLPVLLAEYPDDASLQELTNRQRTSPRGGIPKTEAALCYARILVSCHMPDLKHARQLLHTDTRWARVDAALATVAGDGTDGVRRGYFWMLIGDDDIVKPDRMVLRWLDRHGYRVDPRTVRIMIDEVAGAQRLVGLRRELELVINQVFNTPVPVAWT